MRSRQIIETYEFTACVQLLGGARAVDKALEPIIDGLRLNPYGFEQFETDAIAFRFAWVMATTETPSLALIFRIEKDSMVVLLRLLEVSSE